MIFFMAKLLSRLLPSDYIALWTILSDNNIYIAHLLFKFWHYVQVIHKSNAVMFRMLRKLELAILDDYQRFVQGFERFLRKRFLHTKKKYSEKNFWWNLTSENR